MNPSAMLLNVTVQQGKCAARLQVPFPESVPSSPTALSFTDDYMHQLALHVHASLCNKVQWKPAARQEQCMRAVRALFDPAPAEGHHDVASVSEDSPDVLAPLSMPRSGHQPAVLARDSR